VKPLRHKNHSRSISSRATAGASPGELAELRARLADAEETLRAIRTGEVDTVMVAGKEGSQVFTLEGAEHAYRVLIESMNEGALTLTADKTILYANQCFAHMVKCPLEQVTGSSFRRFLSSADRTILRPLMKQAAQDGSKIQVLLKADDGSKTPVQISVREMAKDLSGRVTIGMVVTDMTEARRNEEQLRALTHRVVQAQEAERRRVALELHDNIIQLLCAVQFRSQALAESLSARKGSAKSDAIRLRDMLSHAGEEVERISRNLRPGILDQLGLDAVLRDTCTEFAERTGVEVQLDCVVLTARLPVDTELALYRILQEALKNVEQHARARYVIVRLTKQNTYMRLAFNDDGIGFDLAQHLAKRKGSGGLGLLSMHERAISVGGVLTIRSVPGAGTEIEVRMPLPAKTKDQRPPGGSLIKT
jgi:PAS domain S-box-containing protein